MTTAIVFVGACWVVTLTVYGMWKHTVRQPARPMPRNPGPTQVDADHADRFPYA